MSADQERDLARSLAEQREALAHMAVDPRAASIWLNDQVAEEVLIRLEARG